MPEVMRRWSLALLLPGGLREILTMWCQFWEQKLEGTLQGRKPVASPFQSLSKDLPPSLFKCSKDPHRAGVFVPLH